VGDVETQAMPMFLNFCFLRWYGDLSYITKPITVGSPVVYGHINAAFGV